MEQNIKNFDRGVEQMMNEHEVAPPFGMWNRISAELEAMPVAATAPVATSLIPKRAMMGIIAAALILGTTAITGYLVSSSLNGNKNTTVASPVSTQIAAPTQSNVPATVQPAIVAESVNAAPATHHTANKKAKQITASNPVESTIQAAQQVTPTVSQPVAEGNSIIVSNANTDVPTPIEPVAQNVNEETQTYYFPPIDVATTETSKPANESPIAAKNHTKSTTVASNDNDGPSDHKVKFRMHNKKRGWAYGSIIR